MGPMILTYLSAPHKKYLSHRNPAARNTADLISGKIFITYALLVVLNYSGDLQFAQISETPSSSWTHSWTTFPSAPCIRCVSVTGFSQ